MSDTKWRKLFDVLEDRALGLEQMRILFIDVAKPRVMSLPTMGYDYLARPYCDTAEFGPIEFRSIEWLEIPAVARHRRYDNLPDKQVAQDLNRLEAHLAAASVFPIERSGDALRIIGYKR